MISVFTACLLFFVSCFMIDSVTAFADSERSNNRTVKASVFNFEGYHERGADGRLSGYGIEFLNLVSKYSHLNFEYVGYETDWNWDTVVDKDNDGVPDKTILDMLNDGTFDVVTSVSRTAKREEQCEFSLPIGRKKTVLSIRSNETRFVRGNYNTYKGANGGLIRVGQLAGNSQNDILSAFADGKFEYEIVEYESAQRLAEALQEKEIDAIISSNLRKTTNEKELDILDEADFYAVVKKGDPKGLLDEINDAILQMDIDEGDWQNVLFYKYYGPSYSSGLSFSANEQAYIDRLVSGGEKITVTASKESAPYVYTENGELKGIMPDYFAELMRLAGLSENYRFVASDEAAADVTLDSTGDDDITENDVKDCFKTNSYMTARMARVTRRDLKRDVKTVALADPHFKALIERQGYTVVDCDTAEMAIRAVRNREVDAACVYSYTAQWFMNHDQSDTLYYSSVNGMSTNFSMHIGEGSDHELITILNKCIQQMSEDALNLLAAKYTAYTIYDVSFWQFLQANPIIIIAVVVVLILIAFVIFVIALRGQWNRKLLLSTEQLNKKMGEQLSIVEALSRDYVNVYSINDEKATARIIKLEGYVIEGLKKGSAEEYDYASILENYIRTRVYPEDREGLSKALSLDNVIEKLKKDEEFRGSYRIEDRGEIHHFQYTYIKILTDEHEEGGFILAGFRNIDEVIRKEQEQREILSEALEQAQYANKAKTVFLNNMSHDIRTPMNAIIGFTNLASAHIKNTVRVKDYLTKIGQASNHLLNLINDVLDMSRIESGKVVIDEKPENLTEIVQNIRNIIQTDIENKQLQFNVDVNLTNANVFCDRLRLNQILLNLLSNAMKFTPSGGTVSLRLLEKEGQIVGRGDYEIHVADTGIGMSQEFAATIFEPFTRERTATVSGIQGTGLGMSITKNLVDMMAGTITVNTQQGKGTEFVVSMSFRLQENAAKTEEQRAETNREEKNISFEGRRLLLVDDNELNREIATEILQGCGFLVETANNGREAVDAVKNSARGYFDAVLMDVQMPVMNGYEATHEIRKLEDPALANILIIAMTANAFEEDRQAVLDAGMNAHLGKPIDVPKLLDTLKKFLL